MRGQVVPGPGDYLDYGTLVGVGQAPKLSVRVEKRDNGYIVDLVDPPKKRDRPPLPPPPTEEEVNEKIDAMAEGMAAFLRSVMDRASGEEWKEEETKEKIRAAIGAMMPSIANSKVWEPPPPPRMEQKVFEKKADLLKYLDANL